MFWKKTFYETNIKLDWHKHEFVERPSDNQKNFLRIEDRDNNYQTFFAAKNDVVGCQRSKAVSSELTGNNGLTVNYC